MICTVTRSRQVNKKMLKIGKMIYLGDLKRLTFSNDYITLIVFKSIARLVHIQKAKLAKLSTLDQLIQTPCNTLAIR